MLRWVTYSPSRLGGSSAYATVFGYAFTSGLRQKTTLIEGGQPILLNGQQAAWHTQQFSGAILLLVSAIILLFLVRYVKPFFGWIEERMDRQMEGWKSGRLERDGAISELQNIFLPICVIILCLTVNISFCYHR